MKSTPLIQSEYLTALISSIDESVVATDENFVIQYWNKGAERIFGYPANQAIGKPASVVMNFNFPESQMALRETLINNNSWKGKLRHQKEDGKTILLDASVTAVKNEAGKVIGFVGVHRDITEFDQAKTNLATFLSFISSIDDNIFIVDRDLKIVFVNDKMNKGMKSIYGYTYAEGDDLLSKIPAHRKQQVTESFNSAFNGNKSSYEINVHTVSGNEVWLQISYFPVKDSHGYISHACSLIRDISGKKEMEVLNEKLYKSRQLFETFMENSPTLYWVTDKHGKIRYLNPVYINTFHLKKEQIGKSVMEVLPADAAKMFRSNDQVVIEKQQTVQTTETIQPDGVERYYQVVKFPITLDGEIYVGGWAIDISKEIELREEAARHLKKLEHSEKVLREALARQHQLNELKSRFVSMASHEFRTPLSTMLSSVFLLEKYTTEEQHPSRLKHTHRIRESIHHLNALLEDFLSLGKLEEGKTTISPSTFDLENLILDSIEELESIKKPGQAIQFTYDGKRSITTDKKLLRIILLNLVGNALKFSAEEKAVKITGVVTENEISIQVKDEGIGISKEDIEHLFEIFHRGKNVMNIQGTGLGLHIVKRYLQLLNGCIEVSSEIEKGTTVNIRLPAKAT